jgi:hypothetical protein
MGTLAAPEHERARRKDGQTECVRNEPVSEIRQQIAAQLPTQQHACQHTGHERREYHAAGDESDERFRPQQFGDRSHAWRKAKGNQHLERIGKRVREGYRKALAKQIGRHIACYAAGKQPVALGRRGHHHLAQ